MTTNIFLNGMNSNTGCHPFGVKNLFLITFYNIIIPSELRKVEALLLN